MYDVIVIGAGHAGCEAALVASINLCSTLLLTASLDSMALIYGDACLPEALARERSRLEKKGSLLLLAVKQSRFASVSLKGKKPERRRILLDRRQYHIFAKHYLEKQQDLTIKQTIVTLVRVRKGYFEVGTKFDETYLGKTVILSAGTFLNNCSILGHQADSGVRKNKMTDQPLSRCLKNLGFSLRKRIVAASPRLNRDSINGERLETIKIEKDHKFPSVNDCAFSLKLGQEATRTIEAESKKSFFLTKPKDDTAESAEQLLEATPSMDLVSLELQILPESPCSGEMNIVGFKTCLPEEGQSRVLSALPGLEQAEIVRPGYGVEFEYIDPQGTYPTLETKVEGFFLAGQAVGARSLIEAGRQGYIAGVNASSRVRGESPLKQVNEENVSRETFERLGP